MLPWVREGRGVVWRPPESLTVSLPTGGGQVVPSAVVSPASGRWWVLSEHLLND